MRAISLLLLLAACESATPGLRVDVRTDFIPGVEFTTVMLSLEDVADVAPITRTADSDENFVDGVVGGSFDQLPAGRATVRAELLDENGQLLASRRVSADIQRTTALTVVLTRDCAGVACPGAAGVDATECLGGECVRPECSPETPELCPPGCSTDSECPAPTGECASAVCIDGACLAQADASSCDTEQYCEPESGCRELAITVAELLSPVNGYATGSPNAPDAMNAALRPLVRWQPVDDAVAYQVQFTRECGATFQACAFDDPAISVSISSTSFRPPTPLPVPDAQPVGARYAWRVRACFGGDTCDAWSAIRYIDVGRAPSDLNGDGYAELTIGTLTQNRAFVYEGSPSGPPGAPARTLSAPSGPGTSFGFVVRAVGDLNADGFGDFVVGAYEASLPEDDEGAVYVYYGSADGIPALPSVTLDHPEDIAGGQFGRGVGRAGDVNADGFADLVVGAPGTEGGRAYLFFGSADGLDETPTVLNAPDTMPTDRFGYALDGVGDMNGDGFADLAIGAPGRGSGAVFIVEGGPRVSATPSIELGLPAPLDLEGYGSSISSMDENADGLSDLLVGAQPELIVEGAGGAAFAYYGSVEGLSSTPDSTYTPHGEVSDSRFGRPVIGMDWNGDGIGDITVGAPSFEAEGGRLFLYLGRTEPQAERRPDTSRQNPSATPGVQYSAAAANAGDLNGDGIDDLVVGAHWFSEGAPNQGIAYVYLCTPGGPLLSPSLTLANPEPTAFGQFGVSVN